MDAESRMGSRIPDFGAVIERSELVRSLRDAGAVVILAAPSGYGKSILAAQVARQPCFDSAYWADCAGADVSSTQLIEAVMRAVAPGCVHTADPTNPLMPSTDRVSWLGRLSTVLRGHQPRRTCFVLDDVRLVQGDTLSDLIDLLCSTAAVGSQLLLVTRCDDPTLLGVFRNAMVVSLESLRLSDVEAQEILTTHAGRTWDDHVLERLQAIAHGQAATLAVLARHVAAGSLDRVLGGRPSIDIRSHLYRLATEQLDEADLAVLYACSILGSGTVSALRRVVPSVDVGQLERIAESVPLVRADAGYGDAGFRVHDLARSVYTDDVFVRDWIDGSACIRDLAHEQLDERQDYDSLFGHLLRLGDADQLSQWAERRGRRVLSRGNHSLMGEVLQAIGQRSSLARPSLLLLSAQVLRETGDYAEALRKASVARDLARFEGDDLLKYSASLMVARMQIDLGLMADGAQTLESALDLAAECGIEDESTVLARAYLAACHAYAGDYESASAEAACTIALLPRVASPDMRAMVSLCIEAAHDVMHGRWDKAASACAGILVDQDLSLSLKLQVMGNYGYALAALGQLQRSEEVLSAVMEDSRCHGLRMMEYVFMSSLASAVAGQGRYAEAQSVVEEAIQRCEALGDRLVLAEVLTDSAAWLRAHGDPLQSLRLAERALEATGIAGCEWLAWAAVAEIAASELALGDKDAASRQAVGIRQLAATAGCQLVTLSVDAVMAEIDRRSGFADEAIARLIEHEEYIRTDSANWQLGMYIRAFPHLLGLLAQAMGADSLSPYLLRMVLPQDRMGALRASREVMDTEEWSRLAVRLVGEKGLERLNQPPGTPICRVRLFGGLEVSIGDRVVRDKQWRKRKSRLLFAMLVVNRGKDVPRDQLFDYLWPDMDAERARNNLYVIWSAMKSALLDDAAKNTPFPYAENTGGVCRVVRALVDSDLDEFDASIALAEEAESEDNPLGAIRAYERLAEVYRGELLPGDVYDDWFSGIRDRYRIEFGDAMLKAATILESRGEHAKAQKMARRGLQADSWREDLYQAALRAQISGGQRSAAIETYLACRSRLADDLGLDPSGETLRLYEQVLAMEDASEADASAFDEPLV